MNKMYNLCRFIDTTWNSTWELLQPLLGNSKNSKEFLASLSGESQAAGDLFECPWKCKSEQSMKQTDIKNFWDVLKMT